MSITGCNYIYNVFCFIVLLPPHFRSADYVAIGFDLQHVGAEFQKILCDVGVCMDKPTLFLSEVVLTVS